MAERIRLADLLGGLSMIADLGFGLPPGTAVRTSLVAVALARAVRLDDDEVRDAFYTALLMHIGCVAVAHESAAAFGDDIALNRAVSRSNLADPGDITATLVPELTRGMAPDLAGRARAFALSGEVHEWGRRTDTGVCEVARDTARRLGLPATTQQLVQPMFELYVAPYVRNGEAYLTADGVGAAVWLPPGGQLFAGDEEEWFGEALADLVGPDIDRFVQFAEIFDRHHPTEPLYYCQFLATLPAMQGRGIGSALLSDVLARADQDAMPAYHEATTPRNRALYERHGYVAQGEFTLPDGPPLWRMWRDPR